MFRCLHAFDSSLLTVPIHALSGLPSTPSELNLPDHAWRWARLCGFEGKAGEVLLVPASDGGIAAVLIGLGSNSAAQEDFYLAGALPTKLPAGFYRLGYGFAHPLQAALAWALGSYRFEQYKTKKNLRPFPSLMLAKEMPTKRILEMAETLWFVRDLINCPANQLGPEELAAHAGALFERYGGKMACVVGPALLEKNLRLIHAVGAASPRAPRLIDLSWGNPDAPKVTLVGKGVVFDTGGLNLKPEKSMLLMKKDMGGAAHALGLAALIMAQELPVRLRVLIPAVENAVSGAAFRPGDIWPSRKGITVEIGNTDAEGRLILADALSLADEEAPELLIDLATLTGAARVALGPELVPFYTRDETLAQDLTRLSAREKDPLWRMPLWSPYESLLASSLADINHISSSGFAGSILAALFLGRFVEKARSWVHLDIYAWNATSSPGRPEGGEAQALRVLFALLEERYGLIEDREA